MTAGFQPTYKELKQGQNDLLVVLGWSFQPTYKELKLMSSSF